MAIQQRTSLCTRHVGELAEAQDAVAPGRVRPGDGDDDRVARGTYLGFDGICARICAATCNCVISDAKGRPNGATYSACVEFDNYDAENCGDIPGDLRAQANAVAIFDTLETICIRYNDPGSLAPPMSYCRLN